MPDVRFPLVALLAVAAFIAPAWVQAQADAYDDPTKPHRVQLREMVVKDFDKNAVARTELALDRYLAEMTAEGMKTRQVYGAVWREAQLYSGDENAALAEVFYRWILLHSTGHDLSGATRPHSGLTLVGNLIGACRRQGKLAECRRWAAIASRLLTREGIIMDPARYADMGSLFDFLPEVRARNFPLRMNEQLLPSNSNLFLNYKQLRGMEAVAAQAWMEGDWVLAAEQASWVRTVGFALKDNPEENSDFAHMHVMYEFHNATQLLTEILYELGYEDAADVMLYQRIKEMPAYAYGSWRHAHLRQVIWKARRGLVDPETFQNLEEASVKIKASKYASRYLLFLNEQAQVWTRYATGDKAGAFEKLTAIEAGDYRNHHETSLLRIDLSLLEGITDPALEEVFFKLLEKYRSAGNKIAEPGLYRRYAQYLALCGDWEGAIAMQKESLRLYAALGMRARVAEAEALLAAYLSEAGHLHAARRLAAQWDASDPTLPSGIRQRLIDVGDMLATAEPVSRPQIASARVDLQPLSVVTETLLGREAYGYFTLANPTEHTQAGELCLRGSDATLMMDSAGQREIVGTLNPSAAMQEDCLTLELAPGELLVIRLESPAHDLVDGSEAQLSWGTQESQWQFQTGQAASSVSVTNANLVQPNPFYLVPLCHTLMHPGNDQSAIVDFRLVGSVSGRIEVYALDSGELLYVDANGDGDLQDSGDLLTQDANGNQWPDIEFVDTSQPITIEVYFAGSDHAAQTPKTLDVQVLENGEWIIHAVNVLEATSAD